MMPFETYKTYLAMKQHFTRDKYDYHISIVKIRSRATLQKHFINVRTGTIFEKMSRAHRIKR